MALQIGNWCCKPTYGGFPFITGRGSRGSCCTNPPESEILILACINQMAILLGGTLKDLVTTPQNCSYNQNIPKWMCLDKWKFRWNIRTRWFKVTFWYPSWRSLSPLKGHLTIPKRSQRIARKFECYIHLSNFIGAINLSPIDLTNSYNMGPLLDINGVMEPL